MRKNRRGEKNIKDGSMSDNHSMPSPPPTDSPMIGVGTVLFIMTLIEVIDILSFH